jgi:hypothetical protein
MNNIQKKYYLEQLEIEKKITKQKITSLCFFDLHFKLSEIKNVIRKNCDHNWQKTDIETGENNEIICNICKSISYYPLDF